MLQFTSRDYDGDAEQHQRQQKQQHQQHQRRRGRHPKHYGYPFITLLIVTIVSFIIQVRVNGDFIGQSLADTIISTAATATKTTTTTTATVTATASNITINDETDTEREINSPTRHPIDASSSLASSSSSPAAVKTTKKQKKRFRGKWVPKYKKAVEQEQQHVQPSRLDCNSPTNLNSNKKLTVAMILFGIPKEFDVIWKAYKSNIINRNVHHVTSFHVHMHMYNDVWNLTNTKNHEYNINLKDTNTPESIRRIISNNTNNPTTRDNEGKIKLFLTTSSQTAYDETELLPWLNKNENDTKFFDERYWSYETLQNMFRQGNSMKLAYLSAVSTAVSATTANTASKTTDDYDMYIFLRSDTLLLSPIDLPCASVTSASSGREIHIPSWQKSRYDDEYVDRFAICSGSGYGNGTTGAVSAAHTYAIAKSDVFKDIILDHRKRRHRSNNSNDSSNNNSSSILLNEEYVKCGNSTGRLRNSEKMLKLWLNCNTRRTTWKKNSNSSAASRPTTTRSALKVVQKPDNWAQLIRVRGDGKLDNRDRNTFGLQEYTNVREIPESIYIHTGE